MRFTSAGRSLNVSASLAYPHCRPRRPRHSDLRSLTKFSNRPQHRAVESKLQHSMSRFFRRLPIDKPVVRVNYSFQVIASPADADPEDPEELSWALTMKGDEDVDEGKPGCLRPESETGGSYSRASNLADRTEPVDPALVRLRVERQSLRRLPKTGAIVFTIRVYMTPLEELVKEPDVPGRMASAIRSWPEDVAK